MTPRLRGVLLLLLAACGSPGRDRAAPAGKPTAESGEYDLSLPARWVGHYAVDSLSTEERGRALPGALVFLYRPSDSTHRPEPLVVVAAYDSAVWRGIRAAPGPTPGDSVTARAGRVYILAFPQENPFPPNTPDAILYDLLRLRPTELATFVRPR